MRFVAEDWQYYHSWASAYYERELPADVVAEAWDSLILTPSVVAKLNDEIAFDDLAGDIGEILG